jgi:TolB-like protein
MGRGRVFLEELRRRRVIRALIGWGLFAFAMLQVYEPVMHGLHLPEWTLSLVVLLLAAGFPATAALSWIFDLSTEGIERTAPPPPAASGAAPRLNRGRVALLLGAVSLVGAVPGLGWYFLWRAPPPPTAAAATTALAATGSAAATLRTVAVLPLLNLSGDPAQEYFSDGMTEEITSKLSRLSGLAVTARTSAAPYKGSRRSAREIGSELSVAYLVEGSVRKAGDRIRVTASLVRAADAIQLWSEDQNSRLDDVFAVQERIAARIVDALGLKLTPGEERTLGSWGTRNAAAYDEYLKGQARYSENPDNRVTLTEAQAHFEKALAIDPQFAPALGGLASCEAMVYRDWESKPEHLDRAEALAGRALALDPELVPALKAAADVRGFRFDYHDAVARYRRVLQLAPRDHVAWDQLCWALAYVTPPVLDEAEAACRRVIELQPRFPGVHYHLLRVHVLAGRLEDARQELAALERLSKSPLAASGRYWIALAEGRPAEALAAIRERTTNLDEAWRAMALAQLGRRDEAFTSLERALAEGFRDVDDLRVGRWYQPLRTDPRWSATLARHGIAP